MIISYPLVNDQGILNGAEVSCRLSDIYAIEHLTRYVPRPRAERSSLFEDEENYELVPGNVIIHIGRTEFKIQADYAELKAQLIALNEWTE